MQPVRPISTVRRLLPAVLLAGGGGAFLAGMHPAPGLPREDAAPQAPVSLVPPLGDPNIAAGVSSTIASSLPVTSMDPTVTLSSPLAAAVIVTNPPETVPQGTVPAAPTCNGAVDGPIVDTRWGPVQVSASVSADGRLICAVNAPITPTDHRKSVRINDRAVPFLNDFAMFTQGAVFDSVSGATITSQAYKQSLQAILDGNAD
jgi:uncharacterized protein with FMN-binding domain